MQPNHYDLLSQVLEPRAASRMTRDGHQPPRENAGQPRSVSGAAPMRSEDSWIEVSSQPSSSSLSSAATSDDIITTGLRVEHRAGAYHHRSRRRRLQRLAAVTTTQVDYSSRDASLTNSSQEEYEESESESDRVVSSSNEEIGRPRLRAPLPTQPPSSQFDAASSSDEDDASTALGMRISDSPFVPQPNVFTHPPVTQHPSWTRSTDSRRSQPSVLSNSSRRTAIRRDSYPSMGPSRRHPPQHSPYNMISPSHHADHDAALRASLSTLLSCAAAARGIPKPDPQPSTPGPSGAQPSTFRLVGESVAMGEESGGEEPPSSTPYTETSPSIGPPLPRRHQRGPVVSTGPAVSKAKRRSTSPKERGAASKKSRHASITDSTTAVSPTIMTWVISAGVVVLFSAISFSAGYMLGREVGRAEAGIMGDGGVPGARASSAACGQEAVRGGLKRLRWGTAAAGSASMMQS